MSNAVDYYDVQRMVEDEARDRRANDDEIRELVALRTRETIEREREIDNELEVLREAIRVLSKAAAGALISGGTLA